MCTNPHPFLIKRGKTMKSRLLMQDHTYRNWSQLIMAPCGHCDECLKQKQNEYFVRFYRQCLKQSKVQFLTLTYDDDHIPLAVRPYQLDTSSGEVEWQPLQIISYRHRRQCKTKKADQKRLKYRVFNSAIDHLATMPKYHDGNVYFYERLEFDGVVYGEQVSYSLCREDVKLWLKNARLRYEREYGQKLPEFSYSLIGEYGNERARPHYHCCFFGLTWDQAHYLEKQWFYGFTYLESCKAVNPDGSDGFAILSRYVSKYVTKGQYECARVPAGDVEKPRRMQSIGYGTYVSPDEIAQFRAYDLYGEYDPQSFYCPRKGRVLNEFERMRLARVIIQRLRVPIGGDQYRYKLPLILMHKIFDYEWVLSSRKIAFLRLLFPKFDPEAELIVPDKGQMVSSNLYDLVTKVKMDNYNRLCADEFRAFVASRQGDLFSIDINEAYSEFLRLRSETKTQAYYEKNSLVYATCGDDQ